MAATLRLYRMGKKHTPSFRIVAVHKRQKSNGAYIEEVGHYNPLANPHTFELKKDRFDYWVKAGAIISEGLGKLLKEYNKKLKRV